MRNVFAMVAASACEHQPIDSNICDFVVRNTSVRMLRSGPSPGMVDVGESCWVGSSIPFCATGTFLHDEIFSYFDFLKYHGWPSTIG